jgi:hypothetical protein
MKPQAWVFDEKGKDSLNPIIAYVATQKITSPLNESFKHIPSRQEDGIPPREEIRREFERLSSQNVYMLACRRAGVVPKKRIKDMLGYSTELDVKGVSNFELF